MSECSNPSAYGDPACPLSEWKCRVARGDTATWIAEPLVCQCRLRCTSTLEAHWAVVMVKGSRERRCGSERRKAKNETIVRVQLSGGEWGAGCLRFADAPAQALTLCSIVCRGTESTSGGRQRYWVIELVQQSEAGDLGTEQERCGLAAAESCTSSSSSSKPLSLELYKFKIRWCALQPSRT